MNPWVILAFALVALAACVDQLIRTQRFVRAFSTLADVTRRAAEDPDVDLAPAAALMHHVDGLHRADRRAQRLYVVAALAVLIVGLALL